ncbi:hypothetical protein EGW08_013840, partial [Elysia chlorotica]
MTMADRQHDVITFGDVNNDVADPTQSSRCSRLSPQRHRPDSGYNTASPATTTSPAPTYTPSRQEHFFFGDAAAAPAQVEDSLEIFQASTSTCTSPREVSPGPTFSDSHVTQFHMESDDDDEEEDIGRRGQRGRGAGAPPRRVGGSNFMGFQLPNLSNDSDEENADESNDDDEEDVFYSRGNILSQWGVSSEPQTPRYRSGSLSLRTRRYCTPDEDDDPQVPDYSAMATGMAIHGGRPERGRSLRHDVFGSRAFRSHSFSAFRGTSSTIPDDSTSANERRRLEELSCRSPGARGVPLRHSAVSPLACDPRRPQLQQHCRPALDLAMARHGRARADSLDISALEHSVFSFDFEDIDAYHNGQPAAASLNP